MTNPTVTAFETLIEGLLTLLEYAGQKFIKNTSNVSWFNRVVSVVNTVVPVAHNVVDSLTGNSTTTPTITTTPGA
jgi:hypothetical protein